jgi:acyl-CoA synthetase (AMP-forming)/AMP-acid ligase II
MNIAELLEKNAKLYSSKPALVFKDQGITFGKLKETSFRLTNSLAKLGLKQADKVAIYLPNWPEYIYSYLAIFCCGSTVVPLDFMFTEEEIINFINHSQSKILVAFPKKDIDFRNIKNKCALLQKIIILREPETEEFFISWQELLKGNSSLTKQEVAQQDYSSIFYTSGSTGHPKGVLLTYQHLDCPVETVDYFLRPTAKDSFICAGVPFSHIAGLDYMLFMLYFGSTLVLTEHFRPLEFLKNIQEYKVTIFCIVPSMYVAILSLKEYDKFDLSSLRYAVVFGAPSSPILLQRFHKVCPNAYLLNGWGMTETAAPNSFLPTGTETKEIENTGKFPPGMQAKIVDAEGNALGAKQEGELWVKGKAVMAGYYKEPDLTRQVLSEDGWLKTGDIAKCDTKGRYYIVGRKKDMIKVAGEIVFSPEVEEVIQRNPKIKEVAVLGVADKLRGEVPKAFIILKEGENLEVEDLRYFCRQHLAHFKIPHYFEFRTSLPKNRVGKIDKESLKDL